MSKILKKKKKTSKTKKKQEMKRARYRLEDNIELINRLINIDKSTVFGSSTEMYLQKHSLESVSSLNFPMIFPRLSLPSSVMLL